MDRLLLHWTFMAFTFNCTASANIWAFLSKWFSFDFRMSFAAVIFSFCYVLFCFVLLHLWPLNSKHSLCWFHWNCLAPAYLCVTPLARTIQTVYTNWFCDSTLCPMNNSQNANVFPLWLLRLLLILCIFMCVYCVTHFWACNTFEH